MLTSGVCFNVHLVNHFKHRPKNRNFGASHAYLTTEMQKVYTAIIRVHQKLEFSLQIYPTLPGDAARSEQEPVEYFAPFRLSASLPSHRLLCAAPNARSGHLAAIP